MKEYLTSSEMLAVAQAASAAQEHVSAVIQAEAAAFDESQLVRGYAVDKRVTDAAVQGRLSNLTLPFVLSGPELALVRSKESTIILGRSGSGKTTVMTSRIYALERACPGTKQILLTSSPYLSRSIGKQYRAMKADGQLLGKEAVTLDLGLDDMHEEDFSTETLQEVPGGPLFWSMNRFLRCMDHSLPEPRFFGYKLASSFAKPHNRSHATTRPREVDLARWHSHVWPSMPQMARKRFGDHGNFVYNQIHSIIKGSIEAAEKGGPLDRAEYLTLSPERSPTLSQSDAEFVYEIYQRYEKRLKENVEYDNCDVLFSLHSRLREHPEIWQAFNFTTVAVDEVQDLQDSSLVLLKYLLVGRDAYRTTIYAGDTAQMISNITFRFSSLRRLFFSHFLPHCRRTDPLLDARLIARPSEEGSLVPPVHHLTTNFRSSTAIVNVAACIIDLVAELFPASIDKLDRETGLVDGPRPLWLASKDPVELNKAVFGVTGADIVDGEMTLGAGQVVLTRDTTSKARIQETWPTCLCMTPLEMKGLESNEVIIHNLFGNIKRWHILSDAGRDSFDSRRDSAIDTELKIVYVALTRARRNIWIYEESDNADHLRRYLLEKDLITVLDGQPVAPLAKTSTAEEWSAQAKQFFSRQNYAAAMFCFERAGDPRSVECRGFLLVEQATSAEGIEDGLKAIRLFLEGGNIFERLDRHWQAAQAYDNAARLSTKGAADLHLLAGRQYAQCAQQGLARAGAPLLESYLGSLVKDDQDILDEFLETLSDPTIKIPQNDLYVEAIKEVVYRYHDADKRVDQTIKLFEASALLPTSDERVAILEELGYKDLVTKTLLASGGYEQLANILEARSLLNEAAARWKVAGNAERADLLLHAIAKAKLASSSIAAALAIVEYLSPDTDITALVPVLQSPLNSLRDLKAFAMLRNPALSMTNIAMTCIPTKTLRPFSLEVCGVWQALEDLADVSAVFSGRKRELATTAALARHIRTVFAAMQDVRCAPQGGYAISGAMWHALVPKDASDRRDNEKDDAPWIGVTEAELLIHARSFTDSMYSVGSEGLCQTLSQVMPWIKTCPTSEGHLHCREDSCERSRDDSFKHVGRDKRLAVLSSLIQTLSRWSPTNLGSRAPELAFDQALEALIEEVYPLRIQTSDYGLCLAWLRAKGKEAVEAAFAHLQSRPQPVSLHTAVHMAGLSIAAGPTLIFLATAQVGHKAVEEAMLLSRLRVMKDTENPLLHATSKLTDAFFEAALWPSGSTTPAARLFVLERAVTWLTILSSRLSSLVLPERLIQSEIVDSISFTSAALMERNPFAVQGRGTRGYKGKRRYASDMTVIRMRNRILAGIFDRLSNPDRMVSFASTESDGERTAITVRLIICAGIITLNSKGLRTAKASDPKQVAFLSYRSYAKVLRNIVDDARFSKLPQAVKDMAQLPDRAPRQNVFELLRDLNKSLKDPLWLMMDPESQLGAPLAPRDFRDFTSVYAGYSEKCTVVFGKTLDDLLVARQIGQGWTPFGTSATLSATAAPFVPKATVESSAKQEGTEDPAIAMTDEATPEVGDPTDGADHVADDTVDMEDAAQGEEVEELVLDDIAVEQETLDLALPQRIVAVTRRWACMMRADSAVEAIEDLVERREHAALRDMRRAGVTMSAVRLGYLKKCVSLSFEARSLVTDTADFAAFAKQSKSKAHGLITGAGFTSAPVRHVTALGKVPKELAALEEGLAVDRLVRSDAGLTVESLTAASEAVKTYIERVEREYGLVLRTFRNNREKVLETKEKKAGK